MKTSFIALSFICCSLAIDLLSGITAAATEPVLDISGQKLETGVKYYIVPVIRGRGGGLTLKTNGNNTCPIYVVQEKNELSNGLPVTFTPYNAKKGVILTSTDLNIKSFVNPKTTACVQSTVWRLLKELTGVWFLSTGGVEGKPGIDTILNWFKIEKAAKDYIISFCPSQVCDKCITLCNSLGLFRHDDGNKYLALTDTVKPFKVMFKRT
ncbi:hypothetical protein Lal_00046115 [Lupinus albus]|uniref:Uncharacterized protein n=1 Tax=Lupinus albus TaxID=3870 RepID=A0A6A4PFB5_LUPAL|nr:putative proteinase inhibitor I3, Kunitz legume [Lupinus albus]KAF1886877.1 hypothetical protein Lal_00046115 [Lupinus albus]